MSKLLRRSIKKFTIPRTRRSSTPTTSPNFYWDASRGWNLHTLGTHSGAPSITSTIFLLALDAAVDFMQYSFTIVGISFWTSSTILFLHSMFSNLLQIRYHLVHYLEDFVIIPKFFYLRLLQYITIGLLHFFSGVPALRYFAVYVFTTDHFLFWALSVRHFTEPFLSENLRFYRLHRSL